ncbi:MAG: hypothetical protein EBT26_06365 [Microbacteriaceae bacterium]|nr:hypothetical protein [Microbacteriaceae bacterium]
MFQNVFQVAASHPLQVAGHRSEIQLNLLPGCVSMRYPNSEIGLSLDLVGMLQSSLGQPSQVAGYSDVQLTVGRTQKLKALLG